MMVMNPIHELLFGWARPVSLLRSVAAGPAATAGLVEADDVSQDLGGGGAAFPDVLRDPGRQDWVPTPEVATGLGSAGVDILVREVLVDARTRDPNAYGALSGMRHFGGMAGRLFVGGLDARQAAGRHRSKQAAVLPPDALALAPRTGTLIGNDQRLARLRAGRRQIVDARAPHELAGEDLRAIRDGHTPEALATSTRARRRTREGMSPKPGAEPGQRCAHRDPAQEVVVHGQSGLRAVVTADLRHDLALHDVKVHAPGWPGHAGMLNQPATQEVNLDVGGLDVRLGALSVRPPELDTALAGQEVAR